MSPELVIFALRSIMRLGTAADRAYSQSVRDQNILFPELIRLEPKKERTISKFFGELTPEGNEERFDKYLKPPEGKYKEYFKDGTFDLSTPAKVDALFAITIEISLKEKSSTKEVENAVQKVAQKNIERMSGKALVEQWSDAGQKVSPIARIIMTVADIGLEYIGTNPSILGIGGNGEKLVGAIATNISDLIPDTSEFGRKEQFVERLLGIVMQSGLKVIEGNPEWITSEDHLQKLISNTLKPVVATFDKLEKDEDFPGLELNFEAVAEALIGPATSAALRTIADNQVEFLGSKFQTEKAVGALTHELITTVAEIGIGDTISKEGALKIYQATLGVIAERPGLFIGEDQGVQTIFARNLITNMAKKLQDSPYPFEGDIAAELGVAALQAVSANTHRFFDQTNNWDKLAGKMAKDVIDSLASGLKTNPNKPWEKIFSKAQLVDLGRIFLVQTAATPQMIAGSNAELKVVVKAVGEAMAADENLLLTAEDWMEIARVAATEAAANPGRLFGLNYNKPNQPLATDLLKILLSTAGEAIAASDKADRSVLYGKTLREAILTLVRAASGSPESAKNNLDKVKTLSQEISTIIADNSSKYGSKEWLRVFRSLLMDTLAGQVPDLNLETVETLIATGGTA